MYQDYILYLFIGVFAIQYFIILFFGLIYSLQSSPEGKELIRSLTIVVPFRNEESRIEPLLESINQSTFEDIELEFVFVDDHSSDNTVTLIESKLTKPHKILKSSERGKKYAIKTGCEHATGEYVLTLDADVQFGNDYFKRIAQLPKRDMWILPVRMEGKSFLGKLASIDFSWIQMLTHHFAKGKRPFLANGANLLFRKDRFLEVDAERGDYDEPSGDDVFLMQLFHEKGFEIESNKDKDLSVHTSAPNRFEELLLQRKRWSSKMRGHLDWRMRLLTALLALVVLVSVLSIICFLISTSILFLIPLGIKYFNEYILMRFYKGGKDFFLDLPTVFVHQFFFPFYLLSIVFYKKRNDPKWDLE